MQKLIINKNGAVLIDNTGAIEKTWNVTQLETMEGIEEILFTIDYLLKGKDVSRIIWEA